MAFLHLLWFFSLKTLVYFRGIDIATLQQS